MHFSHTHYTPPAPGVQARFCPNPASATWVAVGMSCGFMQLVCAEKLYRPEFDRLVDRDPVPPAAPWLAPHPTKTKKKKNREPIRVKPSDSPRPRRLRASLSTLLFAKRKVLERPAKRKRPVFDHDVEDEEDEQKYEDEDSDFVPPARRNLEGRDGGETSDTDAMTFDIDEMEGGIASPRPQSPRGLSDSDGNDGDMIKDGLKDAKGAEVTSPLVQDETNAQTPLMG